jgi:hypothetical protein
MLQNPAPRALSLLILIGVLLGGCKRTSPSNHTTAAPGARVVAMPPANLEIDGKAYAFGPVHISVQAIGGALSIQITAPAADEDDANGLNFDFLLDDVDSPADLSGASWHYVSDSNERSESVNEISLAGRSIVLEPSDITVSFEREGDGDVITIDGQFNWYEPADATAAKTSVAVSGRISASFPK